MEITLNQLINSRKSLDKLFMQDLKARTSFLLFRLQPQVFSELTNYDQARLALCKKLGTLNLETNKYEFGDKLEAFESEYIELINTQITLDTEPLQLDDIADAQLSALDFLALSWLIKV